MSRLAIWLLISIGSAFYNATHERGTLEAFGAAVYFSGLALGVQWLVSRKGEG